MNVAKSFRCFTSSYLLKGLTAYSFYSILFVDQRPYLSKIIEFQCIRCADRSSAVVSLKPDNFKSKTFILATMVNIVDLHDFLPLFVNWKIIYQFLSCNFPVFYPTKVSRKKFSSKPFIQRLQPCEPLEFRIDSTIMVCYESPSSLHYESD